jgi:hypothetical protein
MIEDVISSDRFDKNTDLEDSPPRPTMNGEHLGPQFAGLTRSPEPPAARHPFFIAGKSVHEWRTSPGTGRDETNRSSQ